MGLPLRQRLYEEEHQQVQPVEQQLKKLHKRLLPQPPSLEWQRTNFV
jgi:hypothetical protein